jgi:hypothetical protein
MFSHTCPSLRTRDFSFLRLFHFAISLRVVEELLELQAFLSVRTSELRSTRQLAALTSTKVPKSIREQSLGRVEEMQAEVEEALQRLTCKTTRDLLLIKSSGRYFESTHAWCSPINSKEGDP